MTRSSLATALVGLTAMTGVGLNAPTAQAAVSTGTHTNETVVATAASGAVPNHYATAFPTVRSGSDAANVKALTYLLLGNGVSAPVTTSYTSAVANAVKTYQSTRGLPATGVADATTLAALSTQLTSGTTSARTQAATVLLDKHGYSVPLATPLATSSVKNLDAFAMAQVHAFQAGHGIAQSSFVGNHTWATLFSDKTSGPIFPQMQAGTGAAQWNNCGPVSAVVVALDKGINPPYWNGNPLANSSAVTYFRYTLIGVPNTDTNNKHVGTVPANIIPAFAKVGISANAGSTTDVMAAARAGRPSIAGGDGYQLPWNRLQPSHFRGRPATSSLSSGGTGPTTSSSTPAPCPARTWFTC